MWWWKLCDGKFGQILFKIKMKSDNSKPSASFKNEKSSVYNLLFELIRWNEIINDPSFVWWCWNNGELFVETNIKYEVTKIVSKELKKKIIRSFE